MKIPRDDRRSDVWLRLKQAAIKRRDELRRDNDADRDPIATAKLRGRIAELTTLIDADREGPVVPESPPEA